jgi:hypothetical protein
MSRSVNNNVAGMQKKANNNIQKQQQPAPTMTAAVDSTPSSAMIVETEPQKKDMDVVKPPTENYSLVKEKEVNQSSQPLTTTTSSTSTNKKRKRENDDEDKESTLDLFDTKIRELAQNPKLGYVDPQIAQINQMRSQQRQMKNTIQNNYQQKMDHGRHIKEVHSVPSHMNIYPMQYYPRSSLKDSYSPKQTSNSSLSSTQSTATNRPSCASSYRTRIPHEEIIEMCTPKNNTISTREELKKFLDAVNVVPFFDSDYMNDDDNNDE